MPTFSASKINILRRAPQGLSVIGGHLVALAAVLAFGALMHAVLPEGASSWLATSSYLAPAGIAFVARWWMAQRV